MSLQVDIDENKAYLSFSIGPVQTFIATARTVRDLWTGSYLLSYLTFKAMEPVLLLDGEPTSENVAKKANRFLFPALEGNPLFEYWKSRHGIPIAESDKDSNKDSRLLASLPNRFIARVPADRAEDLAQCCKKHAIDGWLELSKAVRSRLVEEVVPGLKDWDRLWDDQVKSFFEFHAVVLPLSQCSAETLKELGVPGEGNYAKTLSLLGGLLEAKRSVRHVPDYPPPQGDVPQKCSLMGSYEQMGPATLEESRKFWEAFSRRNLAGTRTRARERLCAVSLVKRFAWAAFLADEPYMKERTLRFQDTATTAARKWLEAAGLPRDERSDWNGQWLHWTTQNEDKDTAPPPCKLWTEIKSLRSSENLGPPPTYYAVLAMDGDKMGDWIQGKKFNSPTELNAGHHRMISQALNDFATKYAPGTVNEKGGDHAASGELIYAGGDDVLAMMPTENALSCARELRNRFESRMNTQLNEKFPEADPATASTGLVVAHYAEDLRYVLDRARAAEKAAKNMGRDALMLTIIRRSGEESSALLPWTLVPPFIDLVDRFRGPRGSNPSGRKRGMTDRWAYKLRADLDTMKALDDGDAVRSLIRQAIGRVEDAADREWLKTWIDNNFDNYLECMMLGRNRSQAEAIEGFLTLCQSASFLARGRESR